MKVLVTGVAGFIGSNTAKYFLEKNYEVVGIDNFNDFYPKKIKEFNISEFKDNTNFKLITGDILDRSLIKNLFESEKFDFVIHLAAWANVTNSVINPDVYIHANVEGTNNLAEFGVKNNLKGFIFASTSSVYGNNNVTPFVENMNTDYPEAPYPATKKACEVLLYSYNVNFKLKVIPCRIFNPVGERMRPDLALPKLIRSAIYGTPFPIFMDPAVSMRDYADVYEIIKTFESALLTENISYEIVNLGNSSPRSLVDLKEIVEKITGKNIEIIKDYKPGQMKETYANVEKAKKLLNYNPSLNLEQMVEKYYNWFIKQPDWYKKGEY
ncbi:GDP-mannose 4,6-dehydratase [Patescibacteria group bacterium]|nr:GDP-mannose 4,6-dehydratase [Patescibacteria group bacterium]